MRALLVSLVFLLGVLGSGALQRGASPPPPEMPLVDPLTAAHLAVEFGAGRISVRGTSVSAGQEDALRQLVAEHYGTATASLEFEPSVLANPGWETASARLIYLVAASDSAVATMRPTAVDVRSVTSRPAVFDARASFLRESLPPGAELSTDVLVVRSAVSLDELCTRAFENLVLQPLSFNESSAEIREASLVAIERITDFARDCRDVSIEIRGHTDASGDESWNRRLSLERAQAVADQIVANGIDPDRLIVTGLGSSEPIADNATAWGREANRRIEFELR